MFASHDRGGHKQLSQQSSKHIVTTEAIAAIGSAEAIESLLVLVAAQEPILDPTFAELDAEHGEFPRI